MKQNWDANRCRIAVKNGSLSVNGRFELGKIYDGIFYSPRPRDCYILFQDLNQSIQTTLHAGLPSYDCKDLQGGEKIKACITFISKSGGMNAELLRTE